MQIKRGRLCSHRRNRKVFFVLLSNFRSHTFVSPPNKISKTGTEKRRHVGNGIFFDAPVVFYLFIIAFYTAGKIPLCVAAKEENGKKGKKPKMESGEREKNLFLCLDPLSPPQPPTGILAETKEGGRKEGEETEGGGKTKPFSFSHFERRGSLKSRVADTFLSAPFCGREREREGSFKKVSSPSSLFQFSHLFLRDSPPPSISGYCLPLPELNKLSKLKSWRATSRLTFAKGGKRRQKKKLLDL